MRASILAGLIALGSTSAMAHQCDVEFSGNLQLENQVIQVNMDNNTTMVIDSNKALYINGTAVSLNNKEQQWVSDYYNGINQAAPQAAGIATDAVALASTALNEVFTELLGVENTALENLSQKLEELDHKIQYNFYADDGEIRLHSDSFKNGDFFGQDWERQFEESIEEIATESIGRIMVAIGTQLIFGGGDMDEFEQKMERFGEQIEEKVEYQSVALEEKADLLCNTLAKVDRAENKLQKHISQLADLDVIQVDKNTHSM